jgi:peptidoglycan/LPS O-acetylase OafA/YrhL
LLLVQIALKKFLSPHFAIYELFIECRFLIFMLIGTAYYLVREKRISQEMWTLSLVCLFGVLILTAVYIPNHPETHFWTYYLWSQGWALFFFFLCATCPRLIQSRVLSFFAAISYPLYLIHGVPGYILMVYLHRLHLHPLLTTSLASIAAVLVAYGLHCLIEKPLLRFSKGLRPKNFAQA